MSCWRRTTVLRIPAIALGFVYSREWEQFLEKHEEDFNWEPGFFAEAMCDSYEYDEYSKWLYEDAQKYVPTGGAVPIMVNGKRTATLVISGLHEGRDHALAVEAVAVFLKIKVPEFLWWAV